MPVSVPRNYPAGCDDDEILRVIGELSGEMISGGADINVVLRFVPLISLGQSELQKRVIQQNNTTTTELHQEVVSLKKITKNYSDSSEKFSKASKKISIVAIILAALSLVVSLVLALQSNYANKQWQDQQLQILTEIKNNTSK